MDVPKTAREIAEERAKEYIRLRDDHLVVVWGFFSQQSLNTLLYHVIGFQKLISNEYVDQVGSELYYFMYTVSDHLKQSTVLFAPQIVEDTEYFIGILNEIDHPYVDTVKRFLIELRNHFGDVKYLPQSKSELLLPSGISSQTEN